MNEATLTKHEHVEHEPIQPLKVIKERYPSYKSLKEDKTRRPTGETVVFIHPGPTIGGKEAKDRLYGALAKAGSSIPPQGICSIAAILRENGYVSYVIDAEPLGLGADEVAAEAMKFNPKYIGLTSYTVSIRVAARIAQRVKEIAKERGVEVKTIIGGPHITFMEKPTLERYAEFDYGIPGEGEITTVELIDALENKTSVSNIPNVVYRDKDGTVQMTPKRTPLQDMDELPLPEWKLLPRLNKYYHPAGDNLYRLPSVAIVTSRGCPGKCYFCNPRGLGTSFRRHSAAYIMRMMKYLQKNFGICDIFIADDMFVFDRKNAFELCRLLKEAKKTKELDVTWSTFARVDYVDRELLAEMHSAGCWQVAYGLESGSPQILKMINKQQSIEQMEKAIHWANEVGIAVRGMFMVGNFGETKETLEETIAFVKRNPIKDFHVTFFTPLPGTPSFVQWKRYGTWDVDITEGSTTSMHFATFLPNGWSRDVLVAYQKRLYTAFIKPSTLWYHLKKFFRPSITLFMLRGGLAYLSYVFSQKSITPPVLRPDHT